jgi:HSP20 family protein
MSKSLKKREEPQMQRWFESAPFGAWRDEMEQMFDSLLGGTRSKLELATMATPRIDMSETDTAVEVETDLPGYKPEEIHIDVIDNRLTISGEHTEEQKQEENGRKYHRIERRTGSFSRSVWLPCRVDDSQVEAQLKDGVLHIRLPKAEEAKRRKIEIKS